MLHNWNVFITVDEQSLRQLHYSWYDLDCCNLLLHDHKEIDTLCLTVRAKPPKIIILAYVAQSLPRASCYQVCERRGVLILIRRVSKLDTLIAGSGVKIILIDVRTTCNVGAPSADADQFLAVLVISLPSCQR